MTIIGEIGLQIILSFLGTIGYALCINVPRSTLLTGGLSGCLGWMIYWSLENFTHAGKVASSLAAALVIGLISFVFSKWKKMPVILFNIPALVPLVPGATAFEAVRALVSGQFVNGIRLFFMVVLVIGAIATGYMLAQVIIDIVYRKKA